MVQINDYIKKHAIKVQYLKPPINISESIKLHVDANLDILPVISNGELKAIHFKDVTTLLITCNNGKKCSEIVPDSIFFDPPYVDLLQNEQTIIESIQKAIERELSIIVMMGDLYIGILSYKRIIALINEYKIKEAIMVNPLTSLPGNYAIKKEFEKRVMSKETFCICYADLNNFKIYNDKYGVSKGDDVIKFTAFLLTEVAKGNFVGHIGGDDFIFFLDPNNAPSVLGKIILEFDKNIVNFYSESHRNRGFVIATDRKGIVRNFPLISIAISVVTVDSPCSFEYVTGALASLKDFVKKECEEKGGSRYAFDKRKQSTIV